MNKQEFRMKNKKHFHHHKAPEVKTTDRLALVFGIGISALTMAMIYLSGAK